MSNQAKAYILTAFTVLFWATAASAFKIALKYVSPYTLLFFSILFSTIALFTIVVIQGKLKLLKQLSRKSIVNSIVLGFLNPFLYYIILFKAYDILPGQIAMSLNYGWPLVLTLLSVPILKQSLSMTQLIAVMVSFTGAVIIATKGQFTSFGDVSQLGVILAAASTVIWAVFWLFNAKDKQDPVIKLLLGFFFGLIFSGIFSLVTGRVALPTETAAWLPLVYVGLFEMGITFVLWLTALQLTTAAAKLGNLIYIAPFLSLLFLNLVIGEKIHPATFIGLFLIISSIMCQEMLSGRQKAK